jgi:hypothetical protein
MIATGLRSRISAAVSVCGADLGGGERVRDELRVHARVPDTPRDQLRVLPAHVEHEHGPLLGGLPSGRHSDRERVRCGHYCRR